MAKVTHQSLLQSHGKLLKTATDGHKGHLDMQGEAHNRQLEHQAWLHSLMMQHAQFYRDAGPEGYLHGMAHVASADAYDPAFYERLGHQLRAGGFDDAGKINLALALAHRQQHQRWD
jgi:hypothetical protein